MPTIHDSGRTLDARPDRVDYRDRPYRPRLVSLPPNWPARDVIEQQIVGYTHSRILDQGSEGACTGFGLAAMINFIRWRMAGEGGEEPELVSPRMLYHMARIYDEWDGEDYDGSSCRGALKGWHHHGVCTESLWPYRDRAGRVRYLRPKEGWQDDAAHRPLGAYYRVDKDSIADMQAAIHEVGAVYVSADVHEGWFLDAADSLPTIVYGSEPTGGHAFCFVGYTRDGFIVQNSWGTGWGYQGFAILTYEDWVANSGDAWVAAIGAPMRVQIGARTRTKTTLYEMASAPRMAPGDPRTPDPGTPWTADWAYQHTVVLGNEGRPLNRLLEFEDATEAVKEVAFELPRRELIGKANPRLLLFAHGGLNDEDASIARIQTLAPFLWENDVYPLFITWKTGAIESITNMLQDSLRKIFRVGPDVPDQGLLDSIRERLREAKDRTIEAACKHLLVKAIWSEMKENAGAGAKTGGGLRTLAQQIARLKKAVPGLEVHLAGHSAGAILAGHLLDLLKPRVGAVSSCTLWAPACTAAFANRHYGRAHARKVLPASSLYIELMSDERELADSVGPYGKSLLYLVSRALESVHKMPILGLEAVHDASAQRVDIWQGQRQIQDVKDWRTFAKKGVDLLVHGSDRSTVSTGCGTSIDLSHGSFDNDQEVVERLVRRVRGRALRLPIGCLSGY